MSIKIPLKKTVVVLQLCSSDLPRKIIKCDTFMLEKESVTEFKLSGDVHFKDLKQHAAVTTHRDTVHTMCSVPLTAVDTSFIDVCLLCRISPF